MKWSINVSKIQIPKSLNKLKILVNNNYFRTLNYHPQIVGHQTFNLALTRGFTKFLCRRSVGFFSRSFLVFLMKESKKRRLEQPGKLMAKSCSQPVNLPGARPLMKPLPNMYSLLSNVHCVCFPTMEKSYDLSLKDESIY